MSKLLPPFAATHGFETSPQWLSQLFRSPFATMAFSANEPFFQMIGSPALPTKQTKQIRGLALFI